MSKMCDEERALAVKAYNRFFHRLKRHNGGIAVEVPLNEFNWMLQQAMLVHSESEEHLATRCSLGLEALLSEYYHAVNTLTDASSGEMSWKFLQFMVARKPAWQLWAVALRMRVITGGGW